jgi:hypothetical protein
MILYFALKQFSTTETFRFSFYMKVCLDLSHTPVQTSLRQFNLCRLNQKITSLNSEEPSHFPGILSFLRIAQSPRQKLCHTSITANRQQQRISE